MEFDTDEHMIAEFRKHWWTLIPHITLAFLGFIVPLAIYSGLSVLPIQFVTDGSFPILLAFIYFTILLFIWIGLFHAWTDYYLDVWVITNKKLIAINQDGFFGRHIKTLNLANIQDITSEVHGINATILEYGDIVVENASSDGAFVIRKVAKPDEVRKKLNDVLTEYHHKGSRANV